MGGEVCGFYGLDLFGPVCAGRCGGHVADEVNECLGCLGIFVQPVLCLKRGGVKLVTRRDRFVYDVRDLSADPADVC